MDTGESIPVKVIDDMIDELNDEEDDASRIITHAIITLQILKDRWNRMQEK